MVKAITALSDTLLARVVPQVGVAAVTCGCRDCWKDNGKQYWCTGGGVNYWGPCLTSGGPCH